MKLLSEWAEEERRRPTYVRLLDTLRLRKENSRKKGEMRRHIALQTARSPALAETIFGLPEILEQILLNLSPLDLLTRVQRVNRTLQATILISPPLRRHLSFQADEVELSARRFSRNDEFNTLLLGNFHGEAYLPGDKVDWHTRLPAESSRRRARILARIWKIFGPRIIEWEARPGGPPYNSRFLQPGPPSLGLSRAPFQVHLLTIRDRLHARMLMQTLENSWADMYATSPAMPVILGITYWAVEIQNTDARAAEQQVPIYQVRKRSLIVDVASSTLGQQVLLAVKLTITNGLIFNLQFEKNTSFSDSEFIMAAMDCDDERLTERELDLILSDLQIDPR